MSTDVIRFEMAAPDDVSQCIQALATADPQSISRLAIIAKVEGAATINDFSRQLALLAFRNMLSSAGLERVPQQIILSTGCEGVTTPGGYLIVETPDKPSPFPALSFGIGASEKIAPQDMIRSGHCEAASKATGRAIANAGLVPKDVALVLIKSPVLTRAMVAAHPAASLARANSTALSRGVAALGAGLALGDIPASEINDDAITVRPDLHGARVMAFSGTETDCCEAIVLGNRPGMGKSLLCGTMRDLIDLDGKRTTAYIKETQQIWELEQTAVPDIVYTESPNFQKWTTEFSMVDSDTESDYSEYEADLESIMAADILVPEPDFSKFSVAKEDMEVI